MQHYHTHWRILLSILNKYAALWHTHWRILLRTEHSRSICRISIVQMFLFCLNSSYSAYTVFSWSKQKCCEWQACEASSEKDNVETRLLCGESPRWKLSLPTCVFSSLVQINVFRYHLQQFRTGIVFIVFQRYSTIFNAVSFHLTLFGTI